MLFDFIFLSNLLPESFSYPQKEGEKETGVVAGYVIEEVNSIFFNFFFDDIGFGKWRHISGPDGRYFNIFQHQRIA